MAPGETDFEIDLENGMKQTTEVTRKDSISGVKTRAIEFFVAMICSMFVDGRTKGEFDVNICHDALNPIGIPTQQLNSTDYTSADKKVVKEKRKKESKKRSPKPPRPPRGPSLDAADLKLIKEITQLAMLKRARVERLKALKKTKTAKGSSSYGNVFAMVFTILLCSLIIFQAMSSRLASANVQEFLTSAETAESGLIAIQYSGNFSVTPPSTPASASPQYTSVQTDQNLVTF